MYVFFVRFFATVVFSPRYSESKLPLCSRLNENVSFLFDFVLYGSNNFIYSFLSGFERLGVKHVSGLLLGYGEAFIEEAQRYEMFWQKDWFGTTQMMWVDEKREKAIQLAYDQHEIITGLYLKPFVTYASDQIWTKNKYRMPICDEWFVFWGGTNEFENYHYVYEGQRYAYDLVRVKNGTTFEGTNLRNENYYAFGTDIVAADINDFIGNAIIFKDEFDHEYEIEINWEKYLKKLDQYKHTAKAVFFITGAYKKYGQKDYFHHFKGIPVKYVEAAVDRGFSIIGTDAFSVDPPFAVMSKAYIETKDQSKLWPAHVLGRCKPYYQIERLCNLEPFEHCDLVEFMALPIKIHCGAAWTRAVARIIE